MDGDALVGVRVRHPSRLRQGRTQPRITRHAVERWLQRVDGTVTNRMCSAALEDVLRHGRRRPRPRHWTRTSAEPGTIYVYDADHPGICAVVRGNAVVTVLTRELCRRTA